MAKNILLTVDALHYAQEAAQMAREPGRSSVPVGVPESLTIIGLVLIGLAFVTVRLGRASRQGPRVV